MKTDAFIPTSAASAVRQRVLLVDDHPVLRHGLRVLIEQEPQFAVCAETDNAPAAVDLARQLAPELAIVDISLKSANGIELTKSLHALCPHLRILIVSMHDEEVYAERALRAGAWGYLMKHEAKEKVVAALGQVLRGEIYVSDRLKGRLLHSFTATSSKDPQTGMGSLSDRELEVLTLIGAGNGTRAIAAQLGLSAKTIDAYGESLKRKLRFDHNSDLRRFAVQWAKSAG